MKNKIIELEIDDESYNTFKDIVERSNKNINQTIMMLIKKTIKENNIDWLYGIEYGEVSGKIIKKNNAIELFNKKGNRICTWNTTYATKTANYPLYWLNPRKKSLTNEWNVILNDNINQILYLFTIPLDVMLKFKRRNDAKEVLDISVKYNDLNFTEEKSGISLRPYLIDYILYKSLTWSYIQ